MCVGATGAPVLVWAGGKAGDEEATTRERPGGRGRVGVGVGVSVGGASVWGAGAVVVGKEKREGQMERELDREKRGAWG